MSAVFRGKPCVRALILAALLALAACDRQKPNASDDVFQSGASDMNARLDAYAEDEATDEGAAEEPAEADQPNEKPPEPADPGTP